MLTNYNVLCDELIAGLEDKVREYLRQGWIPMGGVAVVQNDYPPNSKRYMQAMVCIESVKVKYDHVEVKIYPEEDQDDKDRWRGHVG